MKEDWREQKKISKLYDEDRQQQQGLENSLEVDHTEQQGLTRRDHDKDQELDNIELEFASRPDDDPVSSWVFPVTSLFIVVVFFTIVGVVGHNLGYSNRVIVRRNGYQQI